MANELMLECLRAREEIVFHAAADLIERLERELSDANERHIKEMETRNLTLDAATMGLFEAKKLHAVTMRERDEARAACAKFAIALREHGPKNCTCRFLPYLGKVPPCATCRVKALLDDFRGE